MLLTHLCLYANESLRAAVKTRGIRFPDLFDCVIFPDMLEQIADLFDAIYDAFDYLLAYQLVIQTVPI